MTPAAFGELGAITLDVTTIERTLLPAKVDRCDGSWRLRTIGQGYDDGLGVRYGVAVDGG